MEDTSQRIVAAATRVFGRAGVSGATTREIAREAKVNEVTLFRYFKTKDDLLREVILHSCRRYEYVFSDAPCETAEDVRHTVEAYAKVYLRKMRDNEEFIRTFFGELTRHLKLCRRLFVESTRLVRRRFIDYLLLAQKRGLIRKDLDITTTADALTGMLMAGILRRPLTDPEYSNTRFSKTCLNLFLKGIEP